MRTPTRFLFSLITLAVWFLTLAWAASPVLAADSSSGDYDDDNDCSKGYSCGNPQDSWRGLEMIYFKENLYNVYFKPYNHEDPNQEVQLRIYKRPAGSEAEGCPSHISVPESGQTYYNTDRRHSAVRFAVFKDKLRLFFAKTYDDNTGYILWVKTSPDGTTFPSDSKNLWENRPKDDDHPITIQGLVTKVMNDVLYVLIQAKNTHDLYLITTTDGDNYTSPQKIATLSGNDCLLNGDVITRTSDAQPLLAFVTKDDALGGSKATGAAKVYVFDPSNKSVTQVATLPDTWKDLAVVAGNAYNCTPYSLSALQIWGFKWGHDNLYHMQFIFNDDGKTGSFNPTGYVDTGHNCSEHVDNEFRSYIAACSAPEQVTDGSRVSLQSYDTVWWWGSTTTANAYGKSLKYKADYMKNLGPQGDPTTGEGGPDPKVNYVNDAWVLLGILTGLPPYYPNAIEQEWLGDYYKVSYGNEYELEVSTSVTSEKSLSIGYEKEWLHGKVSMGTSYSYALEETNGTTQQTTAKETLEFDPSFITPGIEEGAQAWGIFMAPYITSDRYQLYAPDKTTDLGLTFYYTYIGDNSSIVAQVFDMTDPENPVNDDFFHGFPALPNSLDYETWQDHGPAIVNTGTGDYDTLLSKQILCNNCSTDFEFSQSVSVENEQKNTNKVSFSGGAFGFEGEMEGSFSMSSSTKTTLGQNITVHYGVPGFEEKDPPPADYNLYLTYMNMNMYLLNAKTKNAFFVPEGAKTADCQQYPWCLTWDVLTYKNMGMYTAEVGSQAMHQTVGSALAAAPGMKADMVIYSDTAETGALLLEEGMGLMIKGAAATLDRQGNPTATVSNLAAVVKPGASLHLENLILQAGSAGPAIETGGSLSIKNCRILGDDGFDGIVQTGGTLSMEKAYISKAGGHGLRVDQGHADLTNCVVIENGGSGIRNENGSLVLVHGVLIQNGGPDFSSGQSARTEATSTVFGVFAPTARIDWLLNCLVETLPGTAIVAEHAGCLFNMPSGYLVTGGELKGIAPESPCVDKGAALAGEALDIMGRFRGQLPDIGSLEHGDPLEVAAVRRFELMTRDADPSTETDTVRLALEMTSSREMTLDEAAHYAVAFGNHVVTSDQFDAASRTSDGLVFSNDSGKSTLALRLSPDRKTLVVDLKVADKSLYQGLSQYLLNEKDKAGASDTTTVYMPVRASAGKFQTGETWMKFQYQSRNGVGKGSEPRLHPEATPGCKVDCDDDSCFISAMD